MKISLSAGSFAAALCAAAPVAGQTTATQSAAVETRPATTTTNGDRGLWFVPTGEILPRGNWSLSAYRLNLDYEQGFTDVSRWPLTVGAGLGDRVELFGSMTAVTRIDRDIRPLFLAVPPTVGGVVNEHPFVRDGWSGNQLGDLWLGAKFNITSQHRQQAAAFALRGMLKVPTGSKDEGASTGTADVALDAVLSKELNERVELSGLAGLIMRGDPDEYDLLNGIRWGVGMGLPTRRSLRFTAELHGEQYLDDAVTFNGALPAVIEGVPPLRSEQRGPVNASIGLTWQGRNGLFAGAGVNYNLRMDGRGETAGYSDETGDALGFQVRIGYHPGVRVYVAPPPATPPAATPAAENRPPSVRARCEPCTVEMGRTSTVAADGTDPDGDPLAYRWNAASGALSTPADRQSPWTAPMQEGPVPVTVEVTDGRGGYATDAVTIHVIRAPIKEILMEDIHFDFDRYSLRPDATRSLDETVTSLQKDPSLRIQIEGHTCNIGTAEYNLALGERRANAVRDYLTSRGITADRLQSLSYGEERPRHDNAREETRRLNRRAALVVRVQR